MARVQSETCRDGDELICARWAE